MEQFLILPPIMPKNICPYCTHTHAWILRRGKKKCRKCRREYTGNHRPVDGFRATSGDWKRCIRSFLRDRTILRVVEQTNLSKYMAERMIMYIRIQMTKDVPVSFKGPVEMDETYIGGQRKNKRLHIRKIKTKKGHGTDKLPIFGIFDRDSGHVTVFVEPKKLDIAFIIQTMKEHVDEGATVYTDAFKMYRQLSHHGFNHEYIDHEDGEYVNGDIHTNNIEGFWGILKRRMGCIGGMRRKYLHLFVGEIAWRFNHRKLLPREQERTLLTLIFSK